MGVDIFPFSLSGKRISRFAVSNFSSFFPLCLSRLLSLRGLMVAVTNYLGRAHDLPFLSLPDTFLPSHFVQFFARKGKEKEYVCVYMCLVLSCLYGYLFFLSGLHFCGVKQNTYMDFVTDERSFRAGIGYTATSRGPLFCTGQAELQPRQDSRTVLISNSNWRQFFERIFDLLYRGVRSPRAALRLLSPVVHAGAGARRNFLSLIKTALAILRTMRI